MKSDYRIVTREVHEWSTEIEKIMDTPQGRKDYKYRMSSVEAPNSTFKNIFHYDSLQTRGLKRIQGLMFGIAAAYNTIRIFNLLCEKDMLLFDLIDYVKLIGLHEY